MSDSEFLVKLIKRQEELFNNAHRNEPTASNQRRILRAENICLIRL